MTAMAHTTTTRRAGRAEFDPASASMAGVGHPGVVRAMVFGALTVSLTAARPDCSAPPSRSPCSAGTPPSP